MTFSDLQEIHTGQFHTEKNRTVSKTDRDEMGFPRTLTITTTNFDGKSQGVKLISTLEEQESRMHLTKELACQAMEIGR